MVEIDCDRSPVIYPCVIAFFFSSPPFERRPRILEEKIVSCAFVHQHFLIFLVARSGFCAISPVLDGRIRIIAVSVCRSIAGGWLENSRARPLAVEILFEPWRVGKSAISRWNDERGREGVNISRGRNNAE